MRAQDVLRIYAIFIANYYLFTIIYSNSVQDISSPISWEVQFVGRYRLIPIYHGDIQVACE